MDNKNLPDEISITWHIEDVKSLDESLTDQDAKEILQYVNRRHDATIGVNWDMIQSCVNEWKEDQEDR